MSALADPSTGILVGQTTLQPDGKTYAFSLSRIGGTSVACPTFAGIQADAQQARPGYNSTVPFGFANPLIYFLDENSTYSSSSPAYHDVTDHPLGPGYLAEVRNNYTNPYTKQGPLLTYLRTLGIDGEGADALPAVSGLRRLDRRRLACQLHPGCRGARVTCTSNATGGGGPHPGRPLRRC